MKKYSFSLILMLIGVVMLLQSHAQNGTKSFEFDDFFKNYTFYSREPRGLRSMKDGIHYSTSEGRGTKLVIRSYETGDTLKTILDFKAKSNGLISTFSGYSFNNDETKVLLSADQEAVHRHSFTANYFVYDVKTEVLTPVSDKGKQQLATFSPDGTKVAFVRQNNLFYTDLVSGKEIQVTDDGKINHIINGAPDWVYEEEFEFTQAYEWSPDSKILAWMRFDESRVPEFSMSMFQGAEPSLEENSLYPSCTSFKYPKAGEANSIVSVHACNLLSGARHVMDIGIETDIYIPRIRWTRTNDKLAIFRLNRLQNHFEILYANPVTGETHVIYSEENKYYIDEKCFDDIQFLDDNKHFILRSEQDGWNHLFLYTNEGKLKNTITKGNYDILDFIGFDNKNKEVYYTASEIVPYQHEVYCIKWDGSNKRKLSTEPGINSMKFSEGFQYYSITNHNSARPSQTTLYSAGGKQIRMLNDNKALIAKLKEYRFNTKEFFSFTTSDRVLLYGWMIKPPDFDSTKKYPVFMTQYSGPNSQSALDSWELDWENYLAQLGYLIVCVDGRGTALRGEEFRKMTYLQLGKYETIDQVETAKYLGTLPFVDANRMSIWGWSYGGYISASCMVNGGDVFKVAISVAPITNWRYYDNIFTERFMRTPKENPDGYDKNSPLFYAENLKGKLLLCHGLADDNVHVQNTLEFAERLVQANKQFEEQLYVNRNHNIFGGNTTYHLYTRMTRFLIENL